MIEKIELKKLIYSCLNKGYATPEENDKIITFYSAYVGLGGNHEVKCLYEDHYVKLPIHSEENKNNKIVVDLDSYETIAQNLLPTTKNYIYGQFDSDCLDDIIEL